MPMVDIREMRVSVLHCLMLVIMAVRLISIPWKVMAVLVVHVVAVFVQMRHRVVLMGM